MLTINLSSGGKTRNAAKKRANQGIIGRYWTYMGDLLLGAYLIPSIVYITPGYSVHTIGVVDHKKIGHGYNNDDQIQTWYTISVRLMDEDPINDIQSGETIAYIVSLTDWEMVE